LRRAIVEEKDPYLVMQEEVDCNHFDSSQIMSARDSYQEVLMISPKDFVGTNNHNSVMSRQLIQIPNEDEGSFCFQVDHSP
jgi:hypothetical protein